MAPNPGFAQIRAARYYGPSTDRAGERSVDGSVLAFFEGRSEAGVVLLGLVLVGGIGLLDYCTEPVLSVALFYLIPIAVSAWWGGFAPGVLLAVAATAVWHLTDTAVHPATHIAVHIWNAVVRFGFFVIASSVVGRLRASMLREQTLARTDPLTGVANGRTFYEMALLELQRFGRTARPFTLVYLDLDNFKAVNDRLGHSAGDDLLRRVAEVIQANTRANDLVARLGGDEFALLFPETDGAGAPGLLAKLRGALSQEATRQSWPITFSIGAATFLTAPRDVDVMIQCVDALMYAVKRSGKGCLRHEIVRSLQDAPGDPRRSERRATVRLLCNRRARVTVNGSDETGDGFATVCDVSATGIGLTLGYRVVEGTLLTVEPLCNGQVKTLLARVVHASPRANGWLHGCELSNSLSEEELQQWVT
jgi:diguanylate cyclase (GGDEF)-like protein